MIKSNFFPLAALLIFSLSLSSCSIIGDIFKAGMGVGIFLVVAIIVVIVLVMRRIGRK